jgi:hypothetical protein
VIGVGDANLPKKADKDRCPIVEVNFGSNFTKQVQFVDYKLLDLY